MPFIIMRDPLTKLFFFVSMDSCSVDLEDLVLGEMFLPGYTQISMKFEPKISTCTF